MKKITNLILIITMALLLISCNTKPNEEDKKPPIEVTPPLIIDETELELFANGASDYEIVYPTNADSIINSAVSELRLFVGTATNFNLPSKADTGLSHHKDNKYISVGKTSLLDGAGIDVSHEELGESGFKIKLVDNTIFIVGNASNGTIYGVYEFLKHQFDFEVYAIDEIYIKTEVRNMNVLDFNLIEIPSFDYRVANYGEVNYNPTFGRRMRMQRLDDLWIKVGGYLFHNFYKIVDPDVYVDNPEWFSNGQLALWDENNREDLKNIVVDSLKLHIEANPNASMVTFTQEDYNRWSTNDTSNALLEQYGTNAAEMILFINLVAEEIENWLLAEHPNRNITLVMFAYDKTEEAPAVWDEDLEKYVPMDEHMKLRSNVAVMYAPIHADHYYDYYDNENINVAETMQKWNAITETLFVWSYGTYFRYYFVPYDHFNSMQGKYQYSIDNNAQYMFDQAQFNQTVGTDWFRLKQYLSAKLQWDAYLDMNVLIDDFFTNYFKDAKEPMLNFYNDYRTWYAHLAYEMKVTGNTGVTGILNARYWPRGVLLKWEEYLDDAFEAIKHYEYQNPALYQTLKERITLETISVRFLQLEFYGTTYYTGQEYEDMKAQFRRDVLDLGIGRYAELITIATYFK